MLQVSRIAAACVFAVAMAGPAWAGDTGGHRIAITNNSPGPIVVKAFDGNDYSQKDQRQEVQITTRATAYVQCNSPGMCLLVVSYTGPRTGATYPMTQRENRTALSITYNDGSPSGTWTINYGGS